MSNPLSSTSSLQVTRRGVLGMGAALGVGAAVSACGGGSAGTPGGSQAADIAEGPYEGEKVTLAFWNGWTGGDGAYAKQMVETFNSEHENIEVQMNVLEWSDFYSKVPNAVASGAGPDVAAMHVDQVGTNAARGVIMALDEFTGQMDLNEDDFAETVWKAGMYDDKRYAIPLDIHPLGFYYNNTLLQQGGITEPPKDRESWEAALAGMKSGGVQYPFWATATWPAHLIFISLLGQFGGSLYNEDATEATFASDSGVEALEWYASHVDQGFSPPNVANDAQAQAFRQGRDAMTWGGELSPAHRHAAAPARREQAACRPRLPVVVQRELHRVGEVGADPGPQQRPRERRVRRPRGAEHARRPARERHLPAHGPRHR